MEKMDLIKELLVKIQNSPAGERPVYITGLQEIIWDEPAIPDEAVQQVLADLAYDLNFYEPNEQDRDEALGYYGEDRLHKIVGNALLKTKDYPQA